MRDNEFLKFRNMARSSLDDILSIVYNRLPQSLMEFVSPTAEPAYLRVKRWWLILSQLRMPLYILEGKERHSQETLVTAVLGTKASMVYLADLLYSGNPSTHELEKISPLRIETQIGARLAGCSLVFIEVDEVFCRHLARRRFMVLPSWAAFVLDLSKPLDQTWNLKKNKSLRENLRKMRRYEYRFEITRDPAQFEYFYYRMYAPYQSARHKKQWIKIGFHQMKRIFHKGLLFMIKRGEDYLSGNLAVPRGSTLWMYANGVKDAEIRYLKQGALTATYYHAILWSKENGYRKLDFGHCRPFINGGLWYYKKKWGMEVRKSERIKSVLGMRVCKVNRAVEEFMSGNPFVFLHDQKLKSFCRTGQNVYLDGRKFHSLIKSLHMPGIEELCMLSPTGFTDEQKRIAGCSTIPRVHFAHMDLEAFWRCFP